MRMSFFEIKNLIKWKTERQNELNLNIVKTEKKYKEYFYCIKFIKYSLSYDYELKYVVL